jgi:glutamine synthetase
MHLFPNGGIRNTFEARGYTAWDPTSSFLFWNDFMYSNCFYSYTGEVLDYKHLFTCLNAMDEAATDVCKYFDKNVVTAT